MSSIKIKNKMRNLSYIVLALFAVACGSKQQQYTDTEDSLAQYRDTIIGRFNGVDIDTLISAPVDTVGDRMFWRWRIGDTKGHLKPLILHSHFNAKMIYEGDLDGNGTDEFGIRREAEAGTWDGYMIYTYDNGEWKYLVEPIWTWSFHFYNELNMGQDVAERADVKGKVRIRYSQFNDIAYIIDTLLPIEISPVTFGVDD